MPQHVLDTLAATPVEEITVLGRRGPAQASFTTQELRELDELDARDRARRRRRPRARPGAPRSAPPTDRNVTRNLAVLRGWADHAPEPGRTRLRLRFFARPVRLLGEDRVTGVEVERTAVDGDGPGRWAPASSTCCRPTSSSARSATSARRCPACRSTSAPAPCRTRHGRVLRDGTAVARRVRGRLDQARAQRRRRHQQARRPGDRRRRCWPTPPTACCTVAARSATWWRSSSRGAPSRCCSTTGGRSTRPRSRSGATRGRARTTLHEREALLAAVRAATARAARAARREADGSADGAASSVARRGHGRSRPRRTAPGRRCPA